MGESKEAAGGLECSVSFGRFETDALSWERWSTFSPNKYLEEVGKCAAPGSVAQKKAYFESHYKKIIAAKRLEEELPLSDHVTQVENTCPIGCQAGVFQAGNSVGTFIEDEDAPGKNLDGVEENGLECRAESEATLLVEEPEKEPENESHISPKARDGNSELNLQRKPQKVNPVKYEEKHTGRLKKKPESPTGKLPGTSPGKAAKTALLKSSTRSRAERVLATRSKNLSQAEKATKKAVFPKSLHMSINTPPTSRKSLVEDDSIGQSKSFIGERPAFRKPAPSPATVLKTSTPVANRKATDRSLGARAAGMRPLGLGNNEITSRKEEAGGKTDGREAETPRRPPKSKEEKEIDIRKQRKNPGFKATPLPSFYKEQSKSTSGIREDRPPSNS